jgi:virginiamycin A acetyltransferase
VSTAQTIKYPFHFAYSKEIEELLKRQLIFLKYVDQVSGVYEFGRRLTLECRVVIERFVSLCNGQFVSAGSFTYCQSPFHQTTKIGKYCSISWNVSVMGTQHPTEWVTGHVLGFRDYYQDAAARHLGARGIVHGYDKAEFKPLIIGNDVWIGQNVLLRGGIKIGDGAIVGAGSVVTKDIPPYAIVVGNPARILKYRFSDTIIERLRRSCWWDYSFVNFTAFDIRDPTTFLANFENAVSKGLIAKFDSDPTDLGQAIQKSLC